MTEVARTDEITLEDQADQASPATTEAGAETNGTHAEGCPAATVELDFADPHFMDTAHARYAELFAQGPVARVRFALGEAPAAEESTENGSKPKPSLFPTETFFASHYDEVVAILLSDRFSSDPAAMMTPEQRVKLPEVPEELRPFSRSLLTVDPPDHTRLRKLVQPSFTGRAMEALQGNIQQIVDDLLDTAERDAAARGETAPDRQIDLIEAFAYPMPVTVISDMLGLPHEDRSMIRGWTENLLRIDRRRGRELDEETRAGLREFSAYLRDLFAHRRRHPADDMIGQLLHAEEDGDKLDEDEVLAMVFVLFLAGHVTTVNLIGNGVMALLTNPDQLAKFKAEPELARGVVEETLRYWGPVDFITRRTAKEDLDIGETHISKGEQLMAGIAAANRDPAHFPNPDQFDITRTNANRHVAFGKGIHVCLGAPLARVEGLIAFGTLFRRFPDLRLAVPAEELRWGSSFLRGFARLPVLF